MRRVAAAVVLAAIACVSAARAAGPPENVVSGRLTVSGAEAVAEVTIAPSWHVNAHEPRDRFLIPTTLEVTPPAGVRAGPVRYPEPVERRLAFSGGETLLLYEGTVRLTAPLEGTGKGPVRAKLRYQACDDSRCLPPRTLELVSADDGSATAPGGNAIAGLVGRLGFPLTLAWVAALGLALNLTPCVYPLISVTLAFFGGRTGAESGGRVVGRAVCYVLGICLAFSSLGVAAALTGSLFGAALQRPAVLGAIAVLMVGLALGNFGLYQVRLPSGVMRFAGRGGEGAAGALFMGLTMGVVAAPCIGPMVAALLLYVGSQQSVTLGFALFFALSLGMGLPYVGLALAAGRLRRLPRGGPWLAWMEWLFGFLLLGMALHFAGPLLPAAWVRVAWALLVAAAGIVLGFLGPRGSTPMRWVRAAGGVAAVAVALGGLFVADTESLIEWTPYSEVALVRAAAEQRPVFIDFEAEWCLPCREMDHTTFRDPGVVRASRDLAMLRADVTEQDEANETLMRRFQVVGVPTYIVLGPDGQERWRQVGYVPAPELLRALSLGGSGGAREAARG